MTEIEIEEVGNIRDPARHWCTVFDFEGCVLHETFHDPVHIPNEWGWEGGEATTIENLFAHVEEILNANPGATVVGCLAPDFYNRPTSP